MVIFSFVIHYNCVFFFFSFFFKMSLNDMVFLVFPPLMGHLGLQVAHRLMFLTILASTRI